MPTIPRRQAPRGRHDRRGTGRRRSRPADASASSSSTITRSSGAGSSRSSVACRTSPSWAKRRTGSKASRRRSRRSPDVVLLDLHMPGISGIEAMQAILKEAPGTHIVLLTVSEDADDLMAALRSGALGYLLKNIDSDFLIASLRRAAEGESVMSPEMNKKLLRELRTGARPGGGAGPLAARARDRRASRARREQQGDRARSRRRREHGEDPRAAHPAQARAFEPRAGRGVGGGAGRGVEAVGNGHRADAAALGRTSARLCVSVLRGGPVVARRQRRARSISAMRRVICAD